MPLWLCLAALAGLAAVVQTVLHGYFASLCMLLDLASHSRLAWLACRTGKWCILTRTCGQWLVRALAWPG